MKKKILQCCECNADFNVQHDMDDAVYKVTYCPFCGDPLDPDDIDEGDEIDYNEDDEWEDE